MLILDNPSKRQIQHILRLPLNSQPEVDDEYFLQYLRNDGHEIFFYTIPSGFNNNTELLEYFTQNGYQAESINLFKFFSYRYKPELKEGYLMKKRFLVLLTFVPFIVSYIVNSSIRFHGKLYQLY